MGEWKKIEISEQDSAPGFKNKYRMNPEYCFILTSERDNKFIANESSLNKWRTTVNVRDTMFYHIFHLYESDLKLRSQMMLSRWIQLRMQELLWKDIIEHSQHFNAIQPHLPRMTWWELSWIMYQCGMLKDEREETKNSIIRDARVKLETPETLLSLFKTDSLEATSKDLCRIKKNGRVIRVLGNHEIANIFFPDKKVFDSKYFSFLLN